MELQLLKGVNLYIALGAVATLWVITVSLCWLPLVEGKVANDGVAETHHSLPQPHLKSTGALVHTFHSAAEPNVHVQGFHARTRPQAAPKIR